MAYVASSRSAPSPWLNPAFGRLRRLGTSIVPIKFIVLVAKHSECAWARRCCLVPVRGGGFRRGLCRVPSTVTAAGGVRPDEPVESAFLFADPVPYGPRSPSGQSAPSPWRISQGLNSGCPLRYLGHAPLAILKPLPVATARSRRPSDGFTRGSESALLAALKALARCSAHGSEGALDAPVEGPAMGQQRVGRQAMGESGVAPGGGYKKPRKIGRDFPQ